MLTAFYLPLRLILFGKTSYLTERLLFIEAIASSDQHLERFSARQTADSYRNQG